MYRELHAHFVLNIAKRLYSKTFVHLFNFPSAMTEKITYRYYPASCEEKRKVQGYGKA